MVEVGLHAGEVGSLVQRCALVGTWQREQGAVTWEHGCYVRKPQWKCWWSWWGMYRCVPSGRQHVLCAVHSQEQECENLSGKWQTSCCLALLKTLSIGRGWSDRLSLMGKQEWKHCATHRHCPRWGGNFGGFLSTEHEFLCSFLLVFSSILCLPCPCAENYDAIWNTTWPHWASAHIVGKEGWMQVLASWKSFYP